MTVGIRHSVAAGLCLLAACAAQSSTSRAASAGPPQESDEALTRPAGAPSATARGARGWRQVGVASWYGAEHHGKRTASGVLFDMHALTAAHRSLPFGTALRVENPANGKSIVVCVNDRGPFRRDRIIDLSMEAARRIGLASQGTGRVTLEAVAAR